MVEPHFDCIGRVEPKISLLKIQYFVYSFVTR